MIFSRRMTFTCILCSLKLEKDSCESTEFWNNLLHDIKQITLYDFSSIA